MTPNAFRDGFCQREVMLCGEALDLGTLVEIRPTVTVGRPLAPSSDNLSMKDEVTDFALALHVLNVALQVHEAVQVEQAPENVSGPPKARVAALDLRPQVERGGG